MFKIALFITVLNWKLTFECKTFECKKYATEHYKRCELLTCAITRMMSKIIMA